MPKAVVYEFDTTKCIAELRRMLAGKIAYAPAYLSELVEVTCDGQDAYLAGLSLGFAPCEICEAERVIVHCPECRLAPREDCALCDGLGGWLACPNCEGDA